MSDASRLLTPADMFRNLIFDWSGTLCDDLTLTIECTNYVLAQYGLPALDEASFRAEFQLPYPDYYAWKTPGVPIEELEAHYRHVLDNPQSKVTALPHAREFLEFCRARGIRCFILSSMDSKAFVEQAQELGLYGYFEGVHTGILNKEAHIHRLLQQHGLHAHETAFIGDMQHDMHAAHCAHVCGIGVLTGYNNASQLHEAEPDFVVPHLGMLQRFLQQAAAPAPRQDSIHLHGLSFCCRLGVPEEERATPQRVQADISLVPPCSFSAMGDELSRTIDYDALSRSIVRLAQAEPTLLLERLAHKIAAHCVHDWGALEARVDLHKFILPDTVSVSACAHCRR